VRFVSEKEKQIVEKLKDAIPKMSEFDKGYILGKVESMADGSRSYVECGEAEDKEIDDKN
jgi:hypothetical protein